MALVWVLLTYSMEYIPSWEADQSSQLVKKFPAFYGTRSFFTVLTSAISRGSISSCGYFVTLKFSLEGGVSTSPNPQVGGPPLVGCPRLLIQYIHSYPPYRRPFLHPQPEDAPCRGGRDPYSWVSVSLVWINVWRLTGDTVNIICNFLYCNHQVHRDFLITLYISLSFAVYSEIFYHCNALSLWKKLRSEYVTFCITHCIICVTINIASKRLECHWNVM
jgi:hypothetical protein